MKIQRLLLHYIKEGRMCKSVGNSLYFDQIRHHMYEISCKKLKVYQSVEDFLLYTCNCCARNLQQRHACVGNFLHTLTLVLSFLMLCSLCR